MELGRVQVAAGKKAEAKQTLDKIDRRVSRVGVHRRGEADVGGADVTEII